MLVCYSTTADVVGVSMG